MAPEVAYADGKDSKDDRGYDSSADVYSLGLLIWCAVHIASLRFSLTLVPLQALVHWSVAVHRRAGPGHQGDATEERRSADISRGRRTQAHAGGARELGRALLAPGSEAAAGGERRRRDARSRDFQESLRIVGVDACSLLACVCDLDSSECVSRDGCASLRARHSVQKLQI